MSKKTIQNQVTTVKTGSYPGFDPQGNPIQLPLYTNIMNAGKSDRELIATAAILAELGKSDGGLDTKNKIENGTISVREDIIYASRVFPSVGGGQNDVLNFIDESETFKRGEYSFNKSRQLDKYRNGSYHGVSIAVANYDTATSTIGQYSTDIDQADLTGLMSSDFVVVHRGVEIAEIPVWKLVSKTYNKENFSTLDKNLTLLEQRDIQIQLKLSGSGQWRDNIAIRVALIGFGTRPK